MTQAKKLKIDQLKVKSFVTGSEKVVGGTGSLPTGHICYRTVDCIETRYAILC